MTKKTIRLQPISGKFLQTSVNGKQINIWLVNPTDMLQGTEVDYEDALQILAFGHPVATPAQIKGKNGKFIQQLTDEDYKKIEELKAHPNSGVTTATSDDALMTLVKMQGDLLSQMKEEINELKKKKK